MSVLCSKAGGQARYSGLMQQPDKTYPVRDYLPTQSPIRPGTQELMQKAYCFGSCISSASSTGSGRGRGCPQSVSICNEPEIVCSCKLKRCRGLFVQCKGNASLMLPSFRIVQCVLMTSGMSGNLSMANLCFCV